MRSTENSSFEPIPEVGSTSKLQSMKQGSTSTAVSLILQVTPEIADEFTEIKIWQDWNALGPTSARMKFCRTVPVSSIVERINFLIAEEVAKAERLSNQNIQNFLSGVGQQVSMDITLAFHINKVSFEGTDILSSGESSAESIGLKSGSAFQVEYAIYTITHYQYHQVSTCCVIS